MQECLSTDAPSGAPTDPPLCTYGCASGAPTEIARTFTLSPIASTSSAVTGVAAPGPPYLFILTVADFVQTLDAEIEDFLGTDSSCIVKSSAIQYTAFDSVCTERFSGYQLGGIFVGKSFCYSFQTTISPPTPDDGDCDVNGTASSVTEALEAGDFEDAIGSVSRCGSYLGNSCFLYS